MPLIGWWKLDGNAYDSSPSKDNGAMTGVSYSSTYGKIGQGALFTGTGSYIDITQIDITTHHTICFWMHGLANAPSPPDDSVILGQNGTPSNYIAVVDNWGIALDDGVNFLQWTVDTDFYNQWRHIALVFDSTTVTLFLDGESQGTGGSVYDGTFIFDNIGEAETTASYYYNGYLNDVRVYDHKLSKKEIQEIARAKVLHWQFSQEKNTSGDLVLDSSGYERHATLDSSKPLWGPFPPPSGIGSYDWALSSNDYIQMDSTEFPVVFTNEISISLWVYADSISAWDTLVHGTTSNVSWSTSYWLAWSSTTNMRFSIGSSSFNFNPGLVVDAWHHVFATYNGTSVNVFINGVQQTFITPPAVPSSITNTNGIKLGINGNGQYNLDGKLADVRFYNKGYNETDGQAEALRLYQTSASLDINGNLHTRIFSEGGHETKTLCDYTDWTVGTGSVGSWAQYGATVENERVEDLDPWGRSTILWNCVPDGSDSSDGGFYSPTVTIDNTQLYRFSVWANRKILGTDGSQYMGIYPTAAVETLTTGVNEPNPYFWNSSPNATTTPDDWFLIVGHVFPHDIAIGSSNHLESGQYYPATGVFNQTSQTRVQHKEDFMWAAANTSARIRCILYSDQFGTARLSYVYPRIDLVDGTEPTIADLMSGNYYDPNYVNDISNIGKNGTVASTKLSEVGPTENLIGYWPLNGNLLDYSGNERHCETGITASEGERTAATVADGVAPRDKDSYSLPAGVSDSGPAIDMIGFESNGEYILLEDGENWSCSFWGYQTGTIGSYGIFANVLQYTTNGGRVTFVDFDSLGVWTTLANTPNLELTNGVPSGEWFNMVITHNSSNLWTCYVNGVEDGSLTRTGDIFFNRIGRNSTNSSYVSFGGYMMDFRIYDKVLTEPEINILSKTFDTDSTPRTEMKSGGDGLYTFGEFQEDL